MDAEEVCPNTEPLSPRLLETSCGERPWEGDALPPSLALSRSQEPICSEEASACITLILSCPVLPSHSTPWNQALTKSPHRVLALPWTWLPAAVQKPHVLWARWTGISSCWCMAWDRQVRTASRGLECDQMRFHSSPRLLLAPSHSGSCCALGVPQAGAGWDRQTPAMFRGWAL